MLEPYAITVFYIFTECLHSLGLGDGQLGHKSWQLPLFGLLRKKLADDRECRDWLANKEASVKQIRRMYSMAEEYLSKGKPHSRMRLHPESLLPLLRFADIPLLDTLNDAFSPSKFPPFYHFVNSGGELVRVVFTLAPADYRPKRLSTIIPDSGPAAMPANQLLRFNIPIRPAFFLGRSTLLKQLHEQLTDADGRRQMVLLHGVGGMGKSTIMQEYLHRAECEAHFERIFFVPVNRDMQAVFIATSAQALGLSEQIKQFKEPEGQLQFIIGEMSRISGHNLAVIDNVNESDFEDLHTLAPIFQSSGWRFLITSRSVPDGFTPIEVLELSDDDAATLFAYHYLAAEQRLEHTQVLQAELRSYRADRVTREALTQLLGHILSHTLLIELLAKAARKKGLSLNELLERLKTDDIAHPELQRTIVVGRHARLSQGTLYNYILDMFDTEYLMLPTGKAAVDAEHNKKAAMLRFFSVLPAGDIPLPHLKMLWCIDDATAIDFENRLDLLRQIGWLQGKQEISLQAAHKIAYRMHPLVQDVVHKKLVPDQVNCRPLIIALSRIFTPTLANPEAFQQYAATIYRKLKGLSSQAGGLNDQTDGK